MTLREQYEKETGKEVYNKDFGYSGETLFPYVKWLEKKLEEANKPTSVHDTDGYYDKE